MGRGLSELQKTILRIALRNRLVEGDEGINVLRAEVLHEHYEFPYRTNCWDFMGLSYVREFGTCCPIKKRRDFTEHQAFSRNQIGPSRYDKTQVAVANGTADR